MRNQKTFCRGEYAGRRHVSLLTASFEMGLAETWIESTKPVVSICAIRTGCGKSQTTRRVAEVLIEKGYTSPTAIAGFTLMVAPLGSAGLPPTAPPCFLRPPSLPHPARDAPMRELLRPGRFLCHDAAPMDDSLPPGPT